MTVPEGDWLDVVLSGDGGGSITVGGEGNGDAVRSGEGAGHAFRHGAGDGDAIRSSAGEGWAGRSGTGGDADKCLALRTGAGEGTAWAMRCTGSATDAGGDTGERDAGARAHGRGRRGLNAAVGYEKGKLDGRELIEGSRNLDGMQHVLQRGSFRTWALDVQDEGHGLTSELFEGAHGKPGPWQERYVYHGERDGEGRPHGRGIWLRGKEAFAAGQLEHGVLQSGSSSRGTAASTPAGGWTASVCSARRSTRRARSTRP